MPAFITLMRWIRDVAYVEIKTAYDTYLTISVGSTTNIDPIDGVVQPATVAYNPTTAVFDFGIPTSPIVDNTDASLIRADGSVPMDTGYVPAVPLDVVTKEIVDALETKVDGTVYGWVEVYNGVAVTSYDILDATGEGIYKLTGATISGTFGMRDGGGVGYIFGNYTADFTTISFRYIGSTAGVIEAYETTNGVTTNPEFVSVHKWDKLP